MSGTYKDLFLTAKGFLSIIKAIFFGYIVQVTAEALRVLTLYHAFRKVIEKVCANTITSHQYCFIPDVVLDLKGRFRREVPK